MLLENSIFRKQDRLVSDMQATEGGKVITKQWQKEERSNSRQTLEFPAGIFTRKSLPDPGIEPLSLAHPALAVRFFTTSATWEATAGSPPGGKRLEEFTSKVISFGELLKAKQGLPSQRKQICSQDMDSVVTDRKHFQKAPRLNLKLSSR